MLQYVFLLSVADSISGDEPGISSNLTDDDVDAEIDHLLMTPVQGPMHAAKVPVSSGLDKHIAGKTLF